MLCCSSLLLLLLFTGYKADLFGLKIECTVKSIADLVIKVLTVLTVLAS